MLWRKRVDLTQTVIKRTAMLAERPARIEKHDIVVLRNSQENTVPLYGKFLFITVALYI